MIVQDLIETLQDFDPEAEVLLAVQPRYPFECPIDDIVEVHVGEELKPMVYFAAGRKESYLPDEVCVELGWK